jgi:hypothetical protein
MLNIADIIEHRSIPLDTPSAKPALPATVRGARDSPSAKTRAFSNPPRIAHPHRSN